MKTYKYTAKIFVVRTYYSSSYLLGTTDIKRKETSKHILSYYIKEAKKQFKRERTPFTIETIEILDTNKKSGNATGDLYKITGNIEEKTKGIAKFLLWNNFRHTDYFNDSPIRQYTIQLTTQTGA